MHGNKPSTDLFPGGEGEGRAFSVVLAAASSLPHPPPASFLTSG